MIEASRSWVHTYVPGTGTGFKILRGKDSVKCDGQLLMGQPAF